MTEGRGATEPGLRRRILRDFDGFFTRLPVAWAQLIGLQSIKDAQDFLRIAANAEVIDRYKADHILGIDNKGRPQRNAFVPIENP